MPGSLGRHHVLRFADGHWLNYDIETVLPLLSEGDEMNLSAGILDRLDGMHRHDIGVIECGYHLGLRDRQAPRSGQDGQSRAGDQSEHRVCRGKIPSASRVVRARGARKRSYDRLVGFTHLQLPVLVLSCHHRELGVFGLVRRTGHIRVACLDDEAAAVELLLDSLGAEVL